MPTDRIVIVGGGVVGSSIAWHLLHRGFQGEVTVVERDPSYRRASSFLAMGGVRQQFSSAANIRLAQHSVRFYERFDAAMRVPEHRPRAWFRQRGYLFLVDGAGASRFERRYARQRELGQVERLDVDRHSTRGPRPPPRRHPLRVSARTTGREPREVQAASATRRGPAPPTSRGGTRRDAAGPHRR